MKVHTMNAQNESLAVLIDGENAQAAITRSLFEEIAKIGIASVRRIYGDFSDSKLKNWEAPIKEHSLQAFQVYPHASKGNASDFALVIDAMDLLHAKRVQGFCIVSSDSDFTRLASRIREVGIPVYGFGERKTPKPFINACHRFTYVENLRTATSEMLKPDMRERSSIDRSKAPIILPQLSPSKPIIPIEQLVDAVESSTDDTGWAHLSQVGHVLGRMVPDFDTRSFGFSNLTALMKAVDDIEVERRQHENGQTSIFARRKPSTAD
jgi:hypothetical protein